MQLFDWRDINDNSSQSQKEFEAYFEVINKKIEENASYALKYAEKNGRLTEDQEKIFLKDAKCAYLYSYWVLKDKLPKNLEKVFENNPEQAFLYATNIYKGKLPKNLEKAFKKDARFAYEYSLMLKERLDPKIENVFIHDTKKERNHIFPDFWYAYNYAKNILRGKFSEKIHQALFLRYTFDKDCEKEALARYFKKFDN